MLIVGDDKQISPDAVGLDQEFVHRLQREFLFDFNFKSTFDIESSLFDHGKIRYGAQRVTLREHFRCMPEIIRFSNDLCYSDTPLIPLRQYGPNRLPPLDHVYVEGGFRDGTPSRAINKKEAQELVEKIAEMCADSLYDGKTMGVVSLQGEAQAAWIEKLLLERLGVEEIERRRLICGNPYSFQGDERDIMFLSLVTATNTAFATLSKPADERRFNVAASRARDMMILFHSVTSEDLSDKCLRRRLLNFFESTKQQKIAGIGRDELERRAFQDKRADVKPPQPFGSWFEVDVALEILRKNYEVVPQYEVAGKKIDLVVEGGQARLAVECDGDHWHGPEHYEDDMRRQRQLGRCGWEFFRVREGAFYFDRANALAELWQKLGERGIFAYTPRGNSPSRDDLEEDGAEEPNGGSSEDGLEEDGVEEPSAGASEDGLEEDSAEEPSGGASEDDEELYPGGSEKGFPPSSRRPEEITTDEIQNAVCSVLAKCPNHSCTQESLTPRVLKEVGVLTRGKPFRDFKKRVARGVSALEKQEVVQKYKAKNHRVRLLEL
jgi:very-short-patch-repair endonuclease